MSSTPNNNFALLIGVDDYRIFDKAVNLPGAANDARSFFRTCKTLGFAADRIRVLTSLPPLDGEKPQRGFSRADLGDDTRTVNAGLDSEHVVATRDNIRKGIEWLLGKLGAEPVSGLLCFSGHGILSQQRLQLCPADLTPSLAEVIDLAEILNAWPNKAALTRLTLVLDTCHAGKGAADPQDEARRSLKERLASSGGSSGKRLEDTRIRTLAACGADQVAWFGVFGGESRGAFSFALTSAATQWVTPSPAGVPQSAISCGGLLDRAADLLKTLEFDQRPTLTGPTHVRDLRFLGDDRIPGRTVQPTRQFKGQLVPEKYLLEVDVGTEDWTVAAAIDVGSSTETWTEEPSIVARISTATKVRLRRFTGTVFPPRMSNPLQAETDTVVKWTEATNPQYPQAPVRTFAGDYTFINAQGVRVTATAAISFTLASHPSGQKITVTNWFNPDLSDHNIGLAAMENNPLTLQFVTGSYSGTCNKAVSNLT